MAHKNYIHQPQDQGRSHLQKFEPHRDIFLKCRFIYIYIYSEGTP